MGSRIEVRPDILLGKPVIAGTRIPVYLILNLLASGYDFARIVEAYPILDEDDIRAALDYESPSSYDKLYHQYADPA
jgi:uncharacterized protein (DUF433 family)